MNKLVLALLIALSLTGIAQAFVDKMNMDPEDWIFSNTGKKYLFHKTYHMLREQYVTYSRGELSLKHLKLRDELDRVSDLANEKIGNKKNISITSSITKTIQANFDMTRALGLDPIYKVTDESLVYEVTIAENDSIFNCIGRITLYDFRNAEYKDSYPGFYVSLGACKKEGDDDSARRNIGAFFGNTINFPSLEKSDYEKWLTL